MISAYTDARNLGRLVHALGKQYFFIHIDKNVDQKPFENELETCENITFINIRKGYFRRCVGQDHMIEWFV